MDDVWSGFMHQDLDGLLLSVGTKYPKSRLEKIARIVSTVPDGVKLLEKS